MPQLKNLPLVNKAGETATLEGKKVVGLYFSAHWCPPCRGFTPKLVEWFEEWKKTEDKLEIVFVSCDRDQAQFQEYFNSMNFLAVKFDAAEKDELSQQYSVSGIPSLIFVKINEDGTEQIVDKNGRGTVGNSENDKIKGYLN